MKWTIVAEFTPWKSAKAANQGFPPRDPTVKGSPAHR